MLKKIIVTAIASVMLYSQLPLTIHASSALLTPMIKVENRVFVTPKGEPTPYINKDQRTMGSIRLVSNAVGILDKDINWNNKTQTATLSKGDKTVQVTVGKNNIVVNGTTVKMDTVAEMKQGRVFIPVRFIGEALGLYVGYDSISRAVMLSEHPINEMPTNNIETVLGLTVKQQLPITTTVDGLKFTLHEMWFYDYDSAEAKALNDKYEFDSWGGIVSLRKEKPNVKAYVVKSKITMKNESKVAIKYDPNNRNHYYMFMTNIGATKYPTLSKNANLYLDTNNTEMINTFNIAPGESLTGYYYHLINDSKPIEFIALTVSNKFVHDTPIMIAEKE